MSNKAAPAPWRSGSMVDYTPGIYDFEGNLIAEVKGISNGGRGRTSDPKAKATQRLMAAAPEMLDALKALLEDACFVTDTEFCECGRFEEGGTCDHVNAAKAIAKAEGRAK